MPLLDFEDFENQVLAPFGDHPQSVGKAKFLLANLRDAIAGLLELGHRVGVGFQPPPEPQEWPKMLYRSTGDGPGNTVEVHTREEQDAMEKEGWRNHPTPEGEPEPMPPPVEAPRTESMKDGSTKVHWPEKPVPASGEGMNQHQAGEPSEDAPKAHEPMATDPAVAAHPEPEPTPPTPPAPEPPHHDESVPANEPVTIKPINQRP